MPLIPKQAILRTHGSGYELAIAALEAQMDELPEVRIVSISIATPTLYTVQVVAVVETV